MCGIVAIDRLTEITRNMIPTLALEIERRGIDSWGLTNGQEIYRRLGPISEGLLGVLKSGKIDNWEKLLMHTRAASTGTVDLQNCHPLVGVGNDRTIIGIHNGVISNHAEMNQLMGRNITCDSMHLFQNLAEDQNWEDLQGWGVAVWTDSKEDHQIINFVKLSSNADVVAMQLESGENVVCSWGDSIKRAARWAESSVKTEFKLKSEILYQMWNGEIVEVGPKAFHKYVPYQRVWPGFTIRVENSKIPELCVYCGRNTVDADKALVCQTCFTELLEVDDTWVMPETRWNSKTLARLGVPNIEVGSIGQIISNIKGTFSGT
jgi:hypothetical protein